MGRQLLEDAARVICPSADTAIRMSRYAKAANLLVAPHEDPADFQARMSRVPALKPDEPMRIAILGHVASHKGGEFLLECVSECQKAGLNARFTVIGHLDVKGSEFDDAMFAVVNVTGPYKSEDIGRLLAEADPHVIFYPQRWPETYSYTLSEGLISGRPLLVPAIGAFPERVADLEWCWTYSLSTTAEEMARMLRSIRDRHLQTGDGPKAPPQVPGVAAVRSDWFYRSEYLAWTPHTARDEQMRASVA
jgi:glycosyltransferase involved in cell wall biosynthesis